MAYISKGLQLIYAAAINTGVAAALGGDYFDVHTELNHIFPGLQEIGSINIAGAGGSYDQIEVTTLADNKHMYVDGLIADSSTSNEITCKFLYDPELFKAFKDSMVHEGSGNYVNSADYVVVIPEGGYFTVNASLASVALDTVSTNSALTFSVTFAVREIEMSTGEYTNA